MVGLTGLEPVTPALSRRCSNQLSYRPEGIHRQKTMKEVGGGNRNRTDDILLAKQALYQLSYTPRCMNPATWRLLKPIKLTGVNRIQERKQS
jgi:hypothetical protein